MRMNLHDDGGWLERSWPPERSGYAWRRKREIMIRWGDGPDERRWFPLAAEADYWEGEAE